MAPSTLKQVPAATAAEVCRDLPLSKEARELLRADLTPGQYLDRLIEGQHHPDAVRFLAQALPKREAVAWACQCARSVLDPKKEPAGQDALKAAERWVADPSEENRRAAMPAAEAAGLGTPAGCAAAAVFLSGGSLGPPNVPEVPPGPDLTPRAVTGAILLATVLTDPVQAPDRSRTFLALGINLANGPPRGPVAGAKR